MTFDTSKTMLLILNPIAGRRRRGLVAAVVRHVRAEGWTVDVIETAAAGDARRLAESCDRARHAVIAVAGGDGTINEVVNGLAWRADRAPALGIVPLVTDILYEDGAFIHAMPHRAGSYEDRTSLMREIRLEGIDL